MTHSRPAPRWVLVWDLPSRVCHWGFAVSCSASLALGLGFNPENPVFKHHFLAGVMALWFLAVRIVLGFSGCRRARWRSLFHLPHRTLQYFVDVARWRAGDHDGLNPGTALFALLVYLGVIGLIVTGFDPDWVETWHRRLAYGVLGLIAFHLAGLALHAWRHRVWSPLAMIHGKWPAQVAVEPSGVRWRAGVGVLVLSGAVTWVVVRCFDLETSLLRIPGLPEIGFPLIQKG